MVLGFALGWALALEVKGTHYFFGEEPAPAVPAAVSAIERIYNREDEVADSKVKIAAAIQQAVSEATSQVAEAASTVELGPEQQETLDSAIEETFSEARSVTDAEIDRFSAPLDETAREAVSTEIRKVLHAGEEGRIPIPLGLLELVEALRAPSVAQLLSGLCLALLLFWPSSLPEFVRSPNPDVDAAPLRFYFGLVFGILFYAMVPYPP